MGNCIAKLFGKGRQQNMSDLEDMVPESTLRVKTQRCMQIAPHALGQYFHILTTNPSKLSRRDLIIYYA